MSDKLVRIKNRYDTIENWINENPILAAGEIGIDSTYNIMKVGDGGSKWNDLDIVNNIYSRIRVSTCDLSEVSAEGYNGAHGSKNTCTVNTWLKTNTDSFWNQIKYIPKYIEINVNGYFPLLYKITYDESNSLSITELSGYDNKLISMTDANDSTDFMIDMKTNTYSDYVHYIYIGVKMTSNIGYSSDDYVSGMNNRFMFVKSY